MNYIFRERIIYRLTCKTNCIISLKKPLTIPSNMPMPGVWMFIYHFRKPVRSYRFATTAKASIRRTRAGAA